MAEIVVGDRHIPLDEDGFLEDASMWDEEVANFLAKTEEVELTEEHWEIIKYLRKYFDDFNVAPPVRRMVKDVHRDLQTIYALFPSGPGKGACKIAGLPKPTGCV
ncbi:sulfur relay protein, TusE/DsrC/DsvC family [Acididesulfobacillus acetoxydans]|uniref:DsrC-like domain n=1 Tax=Acididesulfobacillus acetoxydans TaxID=1561005 RepID=A0A8S0W1W2_9FIRM|nr:TusE/DsrC/DsvC family sulfur relay protein [Acididesulfobacillus acetoxydans]CAA7600028.1 sulfur relay protein, TusE/DsrC/DsvC family [Acididesulfobacillus acetoxydans]CEJ07803.1 DsrC-like domain [Acididesulfobacillus acetoxydans]